MHHTTTATERLQEREERRRSYERVHGYTHCLICKARIRTGQDYCFDCDTTLQALPDQSILSTSEPVEGKDFIIQTCYWVEVTAHGTAKVWATDKDDAERLALDSHPDMDYDVDGVESTKETRRMTLNGMRPFDFKAWQTEAKQGRRMKPLESFGGPT